MKPKLLFILHYPPPIHGAAMIGQYIMESKLINNEFDAKYINLGTSRTIDEIGKGGIKKWVRYLSVLYNALISLILFKPDLVYLTPTAKGGGFYKDIPIIFILKLFKKKVVYHFHNKGVSEKQRKWLDNKLYRFSFKDVSVILLSQYLYPDIEKYVAQTNVYYCPNGIPDLGVGVERKNNDRMVNILFLSNLIDSKGVTVLLEACKIIHKKGIKFKTSFIGAEGNISIYDFKQRVKSLGLTRYIEYAGKKYGKEKIECFSNSDIFVFPTFYETFGLVNLEAMQFALPVISTFEGGIPEVVEDGKTGYLVPQKDALSLAYKLEDLILNPKKRIEMGKAGRIKYENEFTLEKFERRFMKILKNILK